MKSPPAPKEAKGGSILELLSSMTILSVIFLVLSSVLEVSLSQFRKGADRSETVITNQASLDWIRRDFASIMVERYGNVAPLPSHVSETQREFFGRKLFYPVEINRRSGETEFESRSFPNGDPRFDSAAFVTRIPIDSQFSVAYDLGRRGIANQSIVDSAVSWEAMARASLVGYYVAFTYDSPLVGARRGSMRLHRHYRPGDSIMKQAYASGFLFNTSQQINDAYDEGVSGGARSPSEANPAAVRRGDFSNGDFPFLFSEFSYNPANFDSEPGIQAWPANPVAELLSAPPPEYFPDPGTPEEWADPNSDIHNTVFPDEPIAHNVVRFEITPYRRVSLGNGRFETMDAEAMNEHLDLPASDEWPCLVTPGFIDITLGIISEQAARQLETPEQWIVDWSNENPDNWSRERQIIERGLTTHQLRVRINTAAL